MTKEELNNLFNDLESISNNFEDITWTNSRSLKEDLDINSLNTPKQYSKIIKQIEEILYETRVLFLYSTLNKVCQEEGVLYYFDTPFQQGMRYDAVIKKDGSFYLLGEDKDYRELFTGQEFVDFIEMIYWETHIE